MGYTSGNFYESVYTGGTGQGYIQSLNNSTMYLGGSGQGYHLSGTGENSVVLGGVGAGTVCNCEGHQITYPLPVQISITGPLSVCQGSMVSYGIATTLVSGIQWTTSGGVILSGQGTSTINIAWNNSGNYTVEITATDFLGYTTSAHIPVVVHLYVQANVSINNNISCNGFSDGSATVNVITGSAPYYINWSTSPPQNTPTVTGLEAGSYYYVSVSDVFGCAYTDSVLLTQPLPLQSAFVSVQNPLCFGDATGYAEIDVSGGTTPYSYIWNNSVSGTDSLATGLLANQYYTVTVLDHNNCIKTDSIMLTQPAAIVSDVDVLDSIPCYGDKVGTAVVNIQGGTIPYTYLWDNISASITDTAAALMAGVYYHVTITDNHSCVRTDSIIFTEPPALTLLISDSVNVTCYGCSNGTATVHVNGGTPPYTYLWNNNPASTDSIASGLSANTSFLVTVSDSKGCSGVVSVILSQPPPLQVQIFQQANISCYNMTDGSAYIVVSGGIAPYIYTWDNSPVSHDSVAGNLSANIYYHVTVTDAAGMVQIDSIILSQPSQLIAQITDSTNVTCFGCNNGSAIITAGGGTFPYTYLWDNTPASTDTVADNLSANIIYHVTVTDANGCVETDSIMLSQPDYFDIFISDSTNVLCFGQNNGTAQISVIGGIAPFIYLWDNIPVSHDSVAGNLSANVYYHVTVTDATGMVQTDSIMLNQPPVLESNITVVSEIQCHEDSSGIVAAEAFGGTPPYQYLWSSTQSNTNDTLVNISANIFHSITITDSQFCFVTDSVLLTQPDPIELSLHAENPTCNNSNGLAGVSVTGGTSPYQYQWSTGSSSDTINGLITGVYSITVTDQHGCTVHDSVTIQNFSAGTLITTVTNVSCANLSDGSVSALISGGYPPFVFTWSNGSSNATLTNLVAGVYAITVTDSLLCNYYHTDTVFAPESIISTIHKEDVTCHGFNDGSADLLVAGGTPPYTYLWNNGASSQYIQNLSANIYTVVITDENNCMDSASVTITEPEFALSLLLEADSLSCFGVSDGKITAAISGGTIPYLCQWEGNNTTTTDSTLSGLLAGVYTLTVTDSNNCVIIDSASIGQPAKINVAINTISASCEEGEDGVLFISASGGHAGYSIWLNDTLLEEDTVVSNLQAGSYIITVQDSKNCQTEIVTEIGFEPIPCIEIPTCFTPNADGINDRWNIKNLHYYPEVEIEVYNRWGNLMYQGGISDPRWDGLFKGSDCPTGSYIFIVSLKKGIKPIQGIVTIIR